MIVIGLSIPLYICCFINWSKECLPVFVLWSFILLFAMWKSIDNFWLNRRLPVMCPNHYKTVRVKDVEYKQSVGVYDEDSGIHFVHDYKNNLFLIERVMYTNPSRNSKEYEERKYQFITRIEQLKVPIDDKNIEPGIISFSCFVCLEQKNATLENIKLIRNTFVDLAKDDYQQNVYLKYLFNDAIIYIETFHGRFFKAMLVENGKVIEKNCITWENGKPINKASGKLASTIEEMFARHLFGKITLDNIIDEQEFYQLWAKAKE